MTAPRLAVLDSSVGVKWIKPEEGSDTALGLLADHRDGRLRLVVPSHFVHEVVATAVRHAGVGFGEEAWTHLDDAGLTVFGLDDVLARSAFEQCRALSCSFYDALAPALAEQLGATLYSADRRAHGGFAGVVIIGD